MGLFRVTGKPRPTATRVQESTAPEINDELQRRSEARLARAAAEPGGVDRRLDQLNHEWEIERSLQTNFAVINLLSVTLGALVARPFFLLSGIAAGFMFEHALKGWCPPVPVLRRAGFRTTREIDRERYALKALRGDFNGVTQAQPAKAYERAAY